MVWRLRGAQMFVFMKLSSVVFVRRSMRRPAQSRPEP